MKLLNKRGDIPVFMFYLLFGLMLGILFIVGVFTIVNSAVDSSRYHKMFYSRDLALLVDALHAVDGELITMYQINTPGEIQLDINLTNDRVILIDNKGSILGKKVPVFFPFGYNSYVTITPDFLTSPTTMMEFAVVAKDNEITFRKYKYDGDVKLPPIDSEDNQEQNEN